MSCDFIECKNLAKWRVIHRDQLVLYFCGHHHRIYVAAVEPGTLKSERL